MTWWYELVSQHNLDLGINHSLAVHGVILLLVEVFMSFLSLKGSQVFKSRMKNKTRRTHNLDEGDCLLLVSMLNCLATEKPSMERLKVSGKAIDVTNVEWGSREQLFHAVLRLT